MVKKSNKYDGMQDMFIQRAIDDKTAIYESARAKIEAEIEALEKSTEAHDSGLSAAETRNDILSLKDELRYIEQKYYNEIAALKTIQK